jgi:hypothetical protein
LNPDLLITKPVWGLAHPCGERSGPASESRRSRQEARRPAGEPGLARRGRHGVTLFTDCRTCGNLWDVVATGYSARPTDGGGICRYCGTPAPWLNRTDLMAWVRHQVQASRDLADAARAGLVAVLSGSGTWTRDGGRSPRGRCFTNSRRRSTQRPSRCAMRVAESVRRALEAYFGTRPRWRA